MQMNRYKRWWLSNLMCQADAQTAAIIKKKNNKKNDGHWQRRGCQGQICQSSHTVLGGQAMFAWHNKTLKPQLKGNIWKEGLYVSHRERRARDTHRER